MKMNKEINIVIGLLKAALTQKPYLIEQNDIAWEQVEKILQGNRLMNMAYFGTLQMKDTSQIPNDLAIQLKKAYEHAVFIEAHQHFGLEEIKQEFERKNIDFLPLKGSVLKYFYPNPQMRLMGDLDILHHVHDKEKIKETMFELGYHQTIEKEILHDVYERKPFLTVEMHKELISHHDNQKSYFNEIWNRVHLVEGKKHEFEMTWEDFYLFFIAHMAKHFSHSGTGLRSLIDFHVFVQNKGKELNRQMVDIHLQQLQLEKFEKVLIQLDDCVFNDAEWESEELVEVFKYMLMSGIYGNMLYHDINIIGKENKKVMGKIQYLSDLIFIKKEGLEKLYPWLKGRRYLYIFAFTHRLFDRMIHKQEKLKKVVSNLQSNEEIEYLKKIQDIVGLRG